MTSRTREKLTSASVTSSHLSQISEVVSLHFEVKHLTFCVTGLWNEVFVQETLKKAKFNCVWCTKMYSRQSLTGNMGTHKVTQIRKNEIYLAQIFTGMAHTGKFFSQSFLSTTKSWLWSFKLYSAHGLFIFGSIISCVKYNFGINICDLSLGTTLEKSKKK